MALEPLKRVAHGVRLRLASVLAAMLATSAAAGAAPTASQVADINPAGDSFPRSLVNLGGTLLLGADDGTHGVELWRSKGTEAGTTLVKDINPGPADSKPGMPGPSQPALQSSTATSSSRPETRPTALSSGARLPEAPEPAGAG